MSVIGAFALRFAFITAVYAVIVALLGARLRRQDLLRSAERSTYAVFGLQQSHRHRLETCQA